MSYNFKTLDANIADLELKVMYQDHGVVLDALSTLTDKDKLALCVLVRGGTIGAKDYDFYNKPDFAMSKASTTVSRLRIAGFPVCSEHRQCRGQLAKDAYVYYMHYDDLKQLMIDPDSIMKDTRVTAIRRKKKLESQGIDRLVKSYGRLGTAKRVFKHIFGEMNAADVRSLEQCVEHFEEKQVDHA